MLYNSDFSSDEDEHELSPMGWDPNSLIDEIINAEGEERDAKRKELLETFLDQSKPVVTGRMRDFLKEDGVGKLLMSFLTRQNEATEDTVPPKRRPVNNDPQDDGFMRSYNLMEVFLNPSNDMVELYQSQLDTILIEMFKIFEPKSKGNFTHFHKILTRIMSRSPSQTSTALIQNELIWKLFSFAHEPAVADAAMDCVCSSFPKHNDGISHFRALVEANIHEKVGKYLFESNPVSLNVSDLYVRMLEKLSSQELSGVLFLNLCKTPTFLDGLFAVIASPDTSYSAAQKQGCTNMIKELLLRSAEKAIVQHAFARPIPNMLLAIHGKLHEHAKNKVEMLCQIIVERDAAQWPTPELRLSTLTVKRPLGLYLFNILEIMTDLIVANPDSMSQVSPEGLTVLGTWFLEYSNNNLLQGLFFKIFKVLMNSKFEDQQKALLQKNKFISRMIEQYKSVDKKSSHGYILLISNILRLNSDLPKKNTLVGHFLKHHDSWKGFLPLLREDTLKQNTPFSDLAEDEPDISIDLGSTFAKSLGVNEVPPVPEENETEEKLPAIEDKKPKKEEKVKEKEEQKVTKQCDRRKFRRKFRQLRNSGRVRI